MSDKRDDKYLNFPITLLRDGFTSIERVMDHIMSYAGYAHTLKLSKGSDEDKMMAAGNYFGIVYAPWAHSTGRRLHDETSQKVPMTGIKPETAFDYRDNPKTDFEIAVLLAFLALKSIIGGKPYIKTTNEFMIARMGGYAKIDDIPTTRNGDKKLRPELAKFATRRMLDKIKYELQISWGLNFYGRYVRGFYVSFDNDLTLDKLVFHAEKRRKSNIEKQQRIAIEKARAEALRKLETIDVSKWKELN